MITFVTAEDVELTTGVGVKQSDLQQAAHVIEITSGVELDDDSFPLHNTRDQKWLKLAICYQTAWMSEQPDLYSRLDVQSINQDGVTVTTRDSGSFVIAPLAKRALGRCSWNRTGRATTLHASPVHLVGLAVDPIVSDDHVWRPL